ncbi:hypothetical protein NKJ86_08840 [Mesorhizobium sp. M0025]|uniref:hypothetical protein n=1 Tax=Mesorhizobium sp. M0025 TaxID=2956846 RepID=UPI00333DAAAF
MKVIVATEIEMKRAAEIHIMITEAIVSSNITSQPQNNENIVDQTYVSIEDAKRYAESIMSHLETMGYEIRKKPKE